jgi:hypothetical protein
MKYSNKPNAKFPDLSGDGKVTKKDILIGKGVIKKPKMLKAKRKDYVGKPHQDAKFNTKLHDYGRRAHKMTAKERKEYRQGQGIALSFTPIGNTAKALGAAARLGNAATKTTRALKEAKKLGFTGKFVKEAIKPYRSGGRYVAGAGKGETYLVKSPLEMRRVLSQSAQIANARKQNYVTNQLMKNQGINFPTPKNLKDAGKYIKPKMLKSKRKNHV